eukprot:tig00020851_g14706.t1
MSRNQQVGRRVPTSSLPFVPLAGETVYHQARECQFDVETSVGPIIRFFGTCFVSYRRIVMVEVPRLEEASSSHPRIISIPLEVVDEETISNDYSAPREQQMISFKSLDYEAPAVYIVRCLLADRGKAEAALVRTYLVLLARLCATRFRPEIMEQHSGQDVQVFDGEEADSASAAAAAARPPRPPPPRRAGRPTLTGGFVAGLRGLLRGSRGPPAQAAPPAPPPAPAPQPPPQPAPAAPAQPAEAAAAASPAPCRVEEEEEKLRLQPAAASSSSSPPACSSGPPTARKTRPASLSDVAGGESVELKLPMVDMDSGRLCYVRQRIEPRRAAFVDARTGDIFLAAEPRAALEKLAAQASGQAALPCGPLARRYSGVDVQRALRQMRQLASLCPA